MSCQYHDMGLIGSVLALLFCGGSGFYMSPVSFIKRPALWVEMISRHRGTHIQVGIFLVPLKVGHELLHVTVDALLWRCQ